MGKPIVMGRKTRESLARSLPGRTNIVMTRNRHYVAQDGIVVHSLEDALNAAGDAQEVMIIGGAHLYAQTLPRADRLYLTRVEGSFEGDTWFPAFNSYDWLRESIQSHQPDEKNPWHYRFETLTRKPRC